MKYWCQKVFDSAETNEYPYVIADYLFISCSESAI